MKTAHTIPWEAVVNGCPSSQAKSLLPLLLARRCRGIHPSLLDQFDGAVMNRLGELRAARPSGAVPFEPGFLAMASRSGDSWLIELAVPRMASIAQLTTDGKSTVVLQALTRSVLVAWSSLRAVCRDEFARAYVIRYARFDSDVRAFVPADSTDEESPGPRFEFLNPSAWGFSEISKPNSKSMHWTAHNLFSPPNPPQTPVTNPPATRPRFKDQFEESAIDRGDPFQCIAQLRQFQTLCVQRPLDSQAHGLALSLGRCRLFGVRLSNVEDATLTPAAFEHATNGLIKLLKESCKWAMQVEANVESYSAYLLRNVALELLELRMDAHAAYLALDEAYAAATYECEPVAETMGRRLNQVRRLINLFDGNLQKQLPLLRLAASTFLLENWRRLLAPCYRDLPPWWLDGCLE